MGLCSSIENEIGMLEYKLGVAEQTESDLTRKVKLLEKERNALKSEIKTRDIELSELMDHHDEVLESLNSLRGILRRPMPQKQQIGFK